jgi:hypothetical protein
MIVVVKIFVPWEMKLLFASGPPHKINYPSWTTVDASNNLVFNEKNYY